MNIKNLIKELQKYNNENFNEVVVSTDGGKNYKKLNSVNMFSELTQKNKKVTLKHFILLSGGKTDGI